MQIIDLTTERIQAVQQIAIKSWHKTYDELIPETIRTNFLNYAYSEKQLQTRLTNSPFYVAILNGAVVGFANFSKLNAQHTMELQAIYVDPNYEQQGIGNQLLQYAIQTLKPTNILVNVEAGNEIGWHFYNAKGFKEVARFVEHFDGHQLQTIRMQLQPVYISKISNSEQIVRVIHAAFARYKDDPMPSSAIYETTDTIDRNLRDGILIYGATTQEQLVGVVKVKKKEDQLYFSRLAVVPSMQGQGIATKLIQHIEQVARNCNIASVTCDVRSSETDNIRLYQKLGYHITKQEMTTSPLGYVMEVVTMEKQITY